MEPKYYKKNGKRVLHASNFETCLLDGKTKEEIWKLYPKVSNWKNEYYIQKFIYHLKEVHNIEIQAYVERFFDFQWKKMGGVYNGYKIMGNSIIESSFQIGKVNKDNCENFKKGCEKLSNDRKGSSNPMYGKNPWNKGLDKSHPAIKKMAEKRKGTKATLETRKKQSEARAKHPLKARHTTPHTEESKMKMREATAKRYTDGTFNRKSSIHIKVENFLKSIGLKHESEYYIKYYSIDIAFNDKKLAIEIQGDFFHSNPKLYPDGPICNIQKRNFYNDSKKHKYLKEQGWQLLELWESEINDDTYKEKLICKLKELKIL
jgi:very-short-patch-repair endonuclease